mmetsp:Transcript_81966/g.219287  ORF Transcript_81966/g.219287 Transcript_81966/m.219287 type:complete len:145 (+) Transcript_81966:335-769(+)
MIREHHAPERRGTWGSPRIGDREQDLAQFAVARAALGSQMDTITKTTQSTGAGKTIADNVTFATAGPHWKWPEPNWYAAASAIAKHEGSTKHFNRRDDTNVKYRCSSCQSGVTTTGKCRLAAKSTGAAMINAESDELKTHKSHL